LASRSFPPIMGEVPGYRCAMNLKSASVGVLTAEVRVLMVGSRQVTLSVARQLDFVPMSSIEPFGRIKSGSGGDCIEVIGSADGVLSRSRVWRTMQTCSRGNSFLENYVLCPEHDGSYTHFMNHDWYEYDTGIDAWRQAVNFPLIVLAGLR